MTQGIAFAICDFTVALLIIGALTLAIRAKNNPPSVRKALSTLKRGSFKVDKKFVYNDILLCIDDTERKWCVSTKSQFHLFGFSDLIDFKLIESWSNGEMVNRFMGYSIFGIFSHILASRYGTQKMINTCNKLQLKISASDVQHPQIVLNFITERVDKNSKKLYKNPMKKANEMVAMLQYISDQSKWKVEQDMAI